MNFEDLKTPELQEKLMSAKSADELVALAKEGGIELNDEQLDRIAGGRDWDEIDPSSVTCGYCRRQTRYWPSEGKPQNCAYCGTPL